jgi:hypothetical protein
MSSLAALLDDAEKDIQKVGWRKTGPPTKDTRITYDLAVRASYTFSYTFQHTGACPIMRSPENNKLLKLLESFTLTTSTVASWVNDINTSYSLLFRFLLSDGHPYMGCPT